MHIVFATESHRPKAPRDARPSKTVLVARERSNRSRTRFWNPKCVQITANKRNQKKINESKIAIFYLRLFFRGETYSKKLTVDLSVEDDMSGLGSAQPVR
jgi:hypothetical protein